VTRQQLEHAIRAACDIAGDDEVVVIGSQAVLGQFPDAPSELTASMEADLFPRNYPDRAHQIDGAIGEQSHFHATFGYYVHGVGPETAVLPAGWQARLVPVRNANTRLHTGWCLEGHDLAASKLAVPFREKDTDFVAALLWHDMVQAERLHGRLLRMPVDEEGRAQLAARLARIVDAVERARRAGSTSPPSMAAGTWPDANPLSGEM
jgi:hypothetical protein